jgi:hypothetical protein
MPQNLYHIQQQAAAVRHYLQPGLMPQVSCLVLRFYCVTDLPILCSDSGLFVCGL